MTLTFTDKEGVKVMKRITTDFTMKQLKVVAKNLDKKLFEEYKTERVFWSNAKPSEMFNYLVVRSVGNRLCKSNPLSILLPDVISNALYHEKQGFKTMKRFHKAI